MIQIINAHSCDYDFYFYFKNLLSFVKYSKLFFIKKVTIQNHVCSLLQAYNYKFCF